MDPNDQNQQQPSGTTDQPVQDMGVSQPSSTQQTYQVEGQQGVQEPTTTGPSPMPEESNVNSGSFATEPVVPGESQASSSEVGIAQPPTPDVPQTPIEQVNPVEPSVQYGTVGEVTTQPQSEEGGVNNPPQGV